MPRKVRFELHILPLFRLLDRDHMSSFKIDLFSYQSVRDNGDKVISWLSQGMPPQSHGGPWPEEWINIFQRWVNEGCLKMESAKANYTAKRDGSRVILTASGDAPNEDDTVWLQVLNENQNPREYTLYREPAEGAADPGYFEVTDTFEAAPEVTSVVVYDEDGHHLLPITAS